MDAERKKVIIIDDDQDIVKLLDHEFKALGFEVQSFGLGKDAINFLLVEENLTDVFLLVLDRILPDMDGLDILHQFNVKSRIKIPVLILSALSNENEVLEGLESGAIDYITKPFSVFQLMQKAIALLEAAK